MNDKVEKMEGSAGEIVLYQRDETIKIEVRLDVEHDTVWLNTMQMSQLFNREESNIRRHVGNIFREGELDKGNNVHFLHVIGVKKPVLFYNLDVIISVGYRVHSTQGILFRRWVTSVLKDYLLHGCAFNRQMVALQQHVDDRTLLLLDKRASGVEAAVFTRYSEKTELDFAKHNAQYEPVRRVQLPHSVHDRYLIVDDNVWLLGSSVKDIGRGLTTIIHTEIDPEYILGCVKR